MSGIDEKLDILQDNILGVVIEYEKYACEYIIIPAIYELAYNYPEYGITSMFIWFLLLVKQFIYAYNQYNLNTLYVMLSFMSFTTLSFLSNNEYILTLLYSLSYSKNITESVGLAIVTKYLSQKSIAYSYCFHVLYIVIRNNFYMYKTQNNSDSKTISIYPIIIKSNIPTVDMRLTTYSNQIELFLTRSLTTILINDYEFR